ncbi:unnamed protein product [Peronospora farinosa]|uniref:Uncharacterized protein n=1 Tax=Peronospora farinosa TaxID=134698 RepID=A0ABN8CFN8_9STRA|nr:unnamed protein product [Peronospora farinosa]
MKDEEMSRLLTSDAYYKKRQGEALFGSNCTNVGIKGSVIGKGRADKEDDEEIDYGFDNANDQIVNRASRLAAHEVLIRVRKKSARYIMRKRDEATFYKTIERDLTMALEEDNTSAMVSRSGEKESLGDVNGGETKLIDYLSSSAVRRQKYRICRSKGDEVCLT